MYVNVVNECVCVRANTVFHSHVAMYISNSIDLAIAPAKQDKSLTELPPPPN